tara:strand:+ start:3945 stop:4592 length:648 start_codon:yes stop_codon:yes gene_type:complete
MAENQFETQYDVTKKSKLRQFYDSNKFLIYSSVFVFLILITSVIFYLDQKEKKRILASENYIQAKIYLSNGEKALAKNILKKAIFANDSTYSTLSIFLILDQKLIENEKELSDLFDHLLENNKFDEEVKHLLIYKKMLLQANYSNELEVLKLAKPLLNSNSLWKAHALLFLGDYFASKKQSIKAKEFYSQVFAIKNLHNDLYEQARLQLALLNHD